MICILFSGGAFGSTIEYCIRRFSNEFTTIESTMQLNGSMHGFKKEFHPLYITDKKLDQYKIITPVYPNFNYLSPVETVLEIKKNLKHDKVILIHFSDIEQVERNQLFAFYKIDNILNTLIPNTKANEWNYKSVDKMARWAIREALSFYIDTLPVYLEVFTVADPSWLIITPNQILNDFANTIKSILNYCNLTIDDYDLDKFYIDWYRAQQYILDEYNQVNRISNSIINSVDCSWTTLSIMSEAIIQSRLRQAGIELACNNLNFFPTNSQELSKYLIR